MLNDTARSMVTALLLAMVFICLDHASQFGSFLRPLAVIMAMQVSLLGVRLGLLARNSTPNMYPRNGFVMLMGFDDE